MIGSVDLLSEIEGEAIKTAKQLVNGKDVELWQGYHMIEMFRRRKRLE